VSERVRILLVEDNPADVDLVREALPDAGAAGFLVESAPRLSAGLARLEAGGIDLVLLDLGLPDSLGLDTLRKTRDAAPNVPVIVLTGNDDQAIGLAAVGEGAQDYLVKGEVTGHSIARSIRHAIERRRAEQTLRESEERFRELFCQMSSGVAVYEAIDDGGDFVFRDFNLAAETIDRIGRNEVIGRRVSEVFPGVKAFGAFDVFQRVWQTGKPEHLPDAMYEDARLSARWRENQVYRLPTGEIVAIYNDITERKQAEARIKSQLEELQRWEAVMLDREDRVREIKREVNELCRRVGEDIRYRSEEAQ
jgi:CheY-like chemotaxis protein